MGSFTFSSRSACSWTGVGDEGTSNPGFPGLDGSMRFIVRVPSCRSNPRKSWTTWTDHARASDRQDDSECVSEAAAGGIGEGGPAQYPANFLGHFGRQLRDIGQSAFFDLAALAVRMADQDRGRRFAIRDDMKEHVCIFIIKRSLSYNKRRGKHKTWSHFANENAA